MNDDEFIKDIMQRFIATINHLNICNNDDDKWRKNLALEVATTYDEKNYELESLDDTMMLLLKMI